MSTGRLSALVPAAAGLLLAGLAAGCAERPTQAPRSPDAYKDRSASSTGYPFRPAPFYRIDELDELPSEKGYTAGY